MITIELVVDRNGLPRSCRASGHAGAGRAGNDIVCAAVSVLMRTAVRALSNRKGISVRGGAPKPGLCWMEADYTAEGKEFLSGAGVFLIQGLASVAEEFPKHCRLIIHNERRA